MTTFLRVLEADDKGAAIRAAASDWRTGADVAGIYQVDSEGLKQVPGTPFAYWVSDRIRQLFKELPPFESQGRRVKQGLATADDFRFVRCWWEVDAATVNAKWFPFAKGGAYSPFYADLHLVVNWGERGLELAAFDRSYIRNPDYYFRPGLTWPRRTTSGFGPRTMPRGAVFGDKGPAVSVTNDDTKLLMALLATMVSSAFRGSIELQLAAAGAAARSYEVGVIQRTPAATLIPATGERLARLATAAWQNKRQVETASAPSHAFEVPALIQAAGEQIGGRRLAWLKHREDFNALVNGIEAEIDDIAFDLYGIEGEDRRLMEEGFVSIGSDDGDPTDAGDEDEAEGADFRALTESLVDWCVGAALGRFDVRLATGKREPPPPPDPFDPLPVCSPGMLQDARGLPTTEAPSGYPLELPPHALLIDDPGHAWDIVARIEKVLELVVGEGAHDWMREIEEILGRDLRDWLRRYGFERHLKRYSRSRRKAPLFWHLAPKSRAYGIWLYSPHATRDSFYRILTDYVNPKLKGAENRLLELRREAADGGTAADRRALADQESLVDDLRAFRAEIERVAPLWVPFRDDGVVLNCAPLWRLFDHHRAWRNECQKKWGELQDGKYDWAGWALHLWPERVIHTCLEDRSIAIAHGLEEELWHEDEGGTWTLRPDAAARAEALIQQRTSTALEAALEKLVNAQ